MKRLRNLALTLTALIAALSMLGVYLVLDDLTNRASEGRADRADLRIELHQQQEKTSILAHQLESLGETPAVQPSVPLPIRYVPIPGPRGPMGPIGPVGADGADGVNGSTGLPGAPGSAGKDGANGIDGKDGTNGADGRGISSVDCGDDGTWTITYTDGTTQAADGPCRAQPVIAP